jgi:uridylate kinase
MGNKQYGIDHARLSEYAAEIAQAASSGVQIAIVIGGGNIFRGLKGTSEGMDRVSGDYMGMLATVINSMALQAELQKHGLKTDLLSGLHIDPICEQTSGDRAISLLDQKHIVIIAGGTGNPFFTTDTASALRALETKAEVLLKGTRVDGVYDSDPEKNKNAVKYEKLSFQEAYDKGLEIMDLTAFTLCRENKMPIIVFDMNHKGNLLKICKGETCGTIIHP